MIHLDTNFLIAATNSDSTCDRILREWMRKGAQLGISAVAWAEYRCGPSIAPSADLMELLGVPLPFTVHDAVTAAFLFNLGGRRRGSLPDCMIAATAIRFGAVLATADGGFRRYEQAGLALHEA